MNSAAAGNSPVSDPHNPTGKKFFGHPRMLANLFSVEMWERFSFYGMQGIMVYYLYYSVADGGLGLPESSATGIIGAYGSMVYLFAIVGGFFGDRVFGPERTLFYSALAIMAGHIALALLPGVAGVIIGMVLVAIGSGGLKTNASVLVGSLYSRTDPRRDAGFTIFYIGVNIGALLGPLLTGFAWKTLGFHFGFGLAAIGMAFGLIQYSLTRKNLPAEVHTISDPLQGHEKRRYSIAAIAVLGIIALLLSLRVVTANNLSSWVMGLILLGASALAYQLLTSQQTTETEHSRVIAFLPLWVGNAVFWALYQQQFTVMAVYSDTRLDWNILGFEFPPSTINSINPVFIILFGTVFSTMWTKLGDRQPPTPIKFALGIIGVGIAFLIFLTQAGNPSVNVGWIVLILFVYSIAELTISPVGFSLATKLAPEAHRSNMMAFYFTSVSMGTVLSGWLAQFYSEETEVAYFSILGVGTIVIGIILWFFNGWILQRMKGIR
ncbi:peptide MFS transporter [Rothia sp. P6271]|uniref:peptide MFS transporter n=1 Tax=Rothia sp. P6271 TaxID=3402659 RepID=UPI003AC75B37